MGFLVEVTDAQHGGVDDYARLTDVALRRTLEPAGGLYIAESRKVIERALAAGHVPRSVLTSSRWQDDMVELARPYDIPIYVAPPVVIEAITGYDVHRGALAAMHRPTPTDLDSILRDARLVVVLENLVDHTNVGAIFRAAAGLGASAVLVSPECADPFYRRSIRVSMGTVLQVPWTRLDTWPGAIETLHAHGFHVAGFALSDDSITLREFERARPEKVAVVFGAEGDGLSRSTLAQVDSVVRIPMLHGVDSLNVASAAAVALYSLS